MNKGAKMNRVKEIGIKLKKTREKMNLSLDNVAEIMKLKKEDIVDIEDGKKELSLVMLNKLSTIYGMTMEYFLYDIEEPELIIK